MVLRSVLWAGHNLKGFKGLALAPALFLMVGIISARRGK